MVVEMFAVLTIDQRKSRGASENRADAWAAELNQRFQSELLLPFALTVGDEIQALTGNPQAALEILVRGVKEGAWWLGMGIGKVEKPLQETAARSRGQAFYNARTAVEAAKRSRHGFMVCGEDPSIVSDLQTVLELVAFLIQRRGHDPIRWKAVELAREGKSTVEIGKALGVSQQAASKRLRSTGFYEEDEGLQLAHRLLGKAMGLRNAR
jgi:hypothetical protein